MRLLLILVLTTTLSSILVLSADAHIERGEIEIVEGYIVEFTPYPLHPSTGENTVLIFSIQDREERDIGRVAARLTILRDGVIEYRSPERTFPTGDFQFDHAFKTPGSHVVRLEVTSPISIMAEFLVEVTEKGEHDLIDAAATIGGGAAIGIVSAVSAYLVFKRVWR